MRNQKKAIAETTLWLVIQPEAIHTHPKRLTALLPVLAAFDDCESVVVIGEVITLHFVYFFHEKTFDYGLGMPVYTYKSGERSYFRFEELSLKLASDRAQFVRALEILKFPNPNDIVKTFFETVLKSEKSAAIETHFKDQPQNN